MDEDARRVRGPRKQWNRTQQRNTVRSCSHVSQPEKQAVQVVFATSTGIRMYDLNTSGQHEGHVGFKVLTPVVMRSRLAFPVPGIFGVSHFPPTHNALF
jgi:hypothetical protein